MKGLEAAAALIAVLGGLCAFVTWCRHRKSTVSRTVEEEIRERDRESSAFQLGRLSYLLLLLEDGCRQGQMQDEEFKRQRDKTLDYLEAVAGQHVRSMVFPEMAASDVLGVAERAIRTQHPGRIENAFCLGGLAQVFELSGGNVAEYRQHLRLLSQHKTRIWTKVGVLLPADRGVRKAARALYDAAARGSPPSRKELGRSIAQLVRYYSNERTERGTG